jgi:hypothetical protein
MCASISGFVLATRSTTCVLAPCAVSVAVPVPDASSRPGPICTETDCWATADDDVARIITSARSGTKLPGLSFSMRIERVLCFPE